MSGVESTAAGARPTAVAGVGADDPATGEESGPDVPVRAANDIGSDQIDELLDAGRRRRRWPWLVAGLVTGVAATVATASYLDTSEATDDAARTESVTLSTATVEIRDLVEQVEYEARLSYGEIVSLLAVADGTITSIVPTGAPIGRGDVLAEVDAEPVVAFIASAPFWRDLENGDEGADVLALEANLVALGFDADGDLTVDEEFTSTTAAAVEEWEESLGLEATGDVPLGRVVAIAGDTSVVERLNVGDVARSGQSLATVQSERVATDLAQPGEGDVTAMVPVGTPIEHGDAIWQLDSIAVTAIVDPGVVGEAVLGVMAENDIELLEEALVFFGFDPEGEIVIDGTGDLATIAAFARFQEAIGIEQTGTIGAQYYVVVPADTTVSESFVADGAAVDGSTLFMTVGSPTLTAFADIVADEIAGFAVGDDVEIEMPDGTTADAVLVDIAEVADAAATEDGSPTIEITIEMTGEVPGGGDAIVTGPVTVLVEASRIEDAMVVPTRGLVSLREGGFAVEVRDPSGVTRLVALELGTFDDGVVEIVSGDVAPGDEVVVPS
jgi:peptidoglycan hydrolase-like protein with peptidoglycan-binding domain